MSEPPDLTLTIAGHAITASISEWSAVVRQVLDRKAADREAWQAERRAAGDVWTAVYWRHHSRYEAEEFSIQDAAGYLVAGVEAGELAVEGIRCPDGSMIIGYAEIETLANAEG